MLGVPYQKHWLSVKSFRHNEFLLGNPQWKHIFGISIQCSCQCASVHGAADVMTNIIALGRAMHDSLDSSYHLGQVHPNKSRKAMQNEDAKWSSLELMQRSYWVTEEWISGRGQSICWKWHRLGTTTGGAKVCCHWRSTRIRYSFQAPPTTILAYSYIQDVHCSN